jgi:hypothetical protein
MPEYKDDRAQRAYDNWQRAVSAIEREAYQASCAGVPMGSNAVKYRKRLARAEYDKVMAKIADDQKAKPILL